MADRPLSSLLRFDATIVEHLERHKCLSAKDFLGKTQFDQIHELDIPLPTLLDVNRLLSTKVAPQPTTVMDMIRKKSVSQNALSTTLAALDAYLRGGLQPASLTEIVGPAGVGKTQFSHMITSISVLPETLGGFGEDTSVLYFDTENAFSSSRLAELLVNRQPLYANQPSNLESMIKRVRVVHITSTDAFLNLLETLGDQLISDEYNIKLIVLDSIASLVRKEFDRSSMPDRQAKISKISSLLKSLAEKFQLPVLITNQVTTNPNESGPSPELSMLLFEVDGLLLGFVTAALGTLWSHAINTRLVLEFADPKVLSLDVRPEELDESIDPSVLANVRLMIIGKSPVAPVVSFPYFIDGRGINLLRRNLDRLNDAMDVDGNDAQQEIEIGDEFVVLINPQNYWDHNISVNRAFTNH